jgi:hypothetical protein
MLRLFTENTPAYHDEIVRILKEHGFEHSTIVQGTGYGPDQGGKAEDSLVIDILLKEYNDATHERMKAAIEEIKKANKRKADGQPQASIPLVRIMAKWDLL